MGVTDAGLYRFVNPHLSLTTEVSPCHTVASGTWHSPPGDQEAVGCDVLDAQLQPFLSSWRKVRQGLVRSKVGRGLGVWVVRTMGSKVNRIAHWSELFHSRPPRCCWRRGQPQSLGIQLVAGDPVVACWSHQLGRSPAQGQRSSHIDGQVP